MLIGFVEKYIENGSNLITHFHWSQIEDLIKFQIFKQIMLWEVETKITLTLLNILGILFLKQTWKYTLPVIF